MIPNRLSYKVRQERGRDIPSSLKRTWLTVLVLLQFLRRGDVTLLCSRVH